MEIGCIFLVGSRTEKPPAGCPGVTKFVKFACRKDAALPFSVVIEVNRQGKDKNQIGS
jgi:hypothetical protein